MIKEMLNEAKYKANRIEKLYTALKEDLNTFKSIKITKFESKGETVVKSMADGTVELLESMGYPDNTYQDEILLYAEELIVNTTWNDAEMLMNKKEFKEVLKTWKSIAANSFEVAAYFQYKYELSKSKEITKILESSIKQIQYFN